jgi:hypothetical protein
VAEEVGEASLLSRDSVCNVVGDGMMAPGTEHVRCNRALEVPVMERGSRIHAPEEV